MSLADYLFPLFLVAWTSAIQSILYDCSSALNFQLVHVGFVSALGVHSKIEFDSSKLLVAMDIGLPTVLAQYTLHSFFSSSVSFSLPFPLFFGPLVIAVRVRGEALG